MKFVGLVTSTALSLCIFCSLATAQAKPDLQDAELLEWRAMMAENKFTVHKTRLNKYALIGAYEELINVTCMKDMPVTFMYEGPGNNRECLDLIEKVMLLDDGSPPATCARDGITASSCKIAYTRQVVTSDFQKSTGAGTGRTRTGGSSSSDYVSKYAKDEELDTLEKEYRALKGDAVILRKIKKKYRQILSEECSGTQYDVRSRESLLANKAEDDESLKDSEKQEEEKSSSFAPDDIEIIESSVLKRKEESEETELDNLIDRLDAVTGGRRIAEKNTNIPEEAEVLRVRILKPGCNAFVTRLLRLAPQSSLGICFRDGLYSPSCIDALRTEKEKAVNFVAPKKGRKKKTDGPGFAKF
jgi:hypothetical protein